jgi:hypothetical protein
LSADGSQPPIAGPGGANPPLGGKRRRPNCNQFQHEMCSICAAEDAADRTSAGAPFREVDPFDAAR